MGDRRADDAPRSYRVGLQTLEPNWLQSDDPLAEALRIDDLRSEYCEQLEARIACLNAEVETLITPTIRMHPDRAISFRKKIPALTYKSRGPRPA
jgi:hypothetical protein